MIRVLRLSLAAALLAVALAAQATNERTSTVGMRARIDELVLPGTELVVAPSTHESPIVLRIVARRAHGDSFRYDLEWTGLDPGDYDLRPYLTRKDGSPITDLPEIKVSVTSVLEPDVREPSDPDAIAPPPVGGYSTAQVVATVIWIFGLLLILFLGRKKKQPPAEEKAPPTLADRLRPFVEAAASGDANDQQKAELERLLLAFWRERLGLQDQKADRAIAAIREHEEAGQLLRQLEAWLHMPEPPAKVDVQALLEPYRKVSAEHFDALTGKSRTGDMPSKGAGAS